MRCDKPCEDFGKFKLCEDGGRSNAYKRCTIYMQQLEEERHIQLNDISLLRMFSKGDKE